MKPNNLEDRLFPTFRDIVEQENIGGHILAQFKKYYLPLSIYLASKHSESPFVIGINGAQGSGKSFLSKVLKALINEGFGKSVVALSIDDLYLSQAKRKELARTIHPLLQVRGVPGTHDIDLGLRLLSSLTRGAPGASLRLPIFDKSIDDLLPESRWLNVSTSADIILLEGWCVGAIPQNQDELKESINDLETLSDGQGAWRSYVNNQLQGPYQELFAFIDCLVMLKVPDMGSVFEWRCLQEHKLRDLQTKMDLPVSNLMSDSELKQFIMHYERITQSTLKEMPDRADVLLELNKQHEICHARFD